MENEVDWRYFNQLAWYHQDLGLFLGKLAMTDANYHFQSQCISEGNSQFHKVNGAWNCKDGMCTNSSESN